jgi:hypothetical protein
MAARRRGCGYDNLGEGLVVPAAFTLSEDEFIALCAEYSRLNPARLRAKLFWPVIGLLLLVPMAIVQLWTWTLSPWLFVTPVLLVIGPLLLPTIPAGEARKMFQQYANLHEPMIVEWTANHLEYRAETWTMKRGWSSFTNWREAEVGLVMLRADGGFSFLLRRTLSESEIAEIRGILQTRASDGSKASF